MEISQNCLDIIKKWEGFRSDAYLDPVGIPTIGYGTTRYPDGRKVKLGESISEQVAEAFLLQDCEIFARGVTEALKTSVNQNQFDALVSFTYNLGIGAFQGSTLLKKINARKFDEAAPEFDRWVYATVDGVKTKLEGLVKRRRDERSLFEKTDGEKPPIKLEASPQDSVTWLEAYRDGENTVVVAWNKEQVVEILTLESNFKQDFIYLLQQYSNASNLHIAPAEKKIPDGNRIAIAGQQKTIQKVTNPPKLDLTLLVRGMNDVNAAGNDIKELQQRLQDLGYYTGEIDGDFGKLTDRAAKDFQADYFGADEADGKVGKLTWEKLWGDSQLIDPEEVDTTIISDKNYLKLTKTSRKDRYGCYILHLDYYKNGKLQDRLEVCSGQPKNQFFRTGKQSVARSYEPLPEGKWYVNDILWKEGKDIYNGAIFLQEKGVTGIGPATVPIKYKSPGSTGRSAIEIHIDWNRQRGFPGTAGCVGVYNIADYKRFVNWLRDTDPRDLYVDWNLGTCPTP
ncbi:MAG: glycoside hydrolase family protein [Cyanobacteria bacterium P01_A01_bin.40]